MPKAYDKEKRFIHLCGKENTLDMEGVYWRSIDAMAKTKRESWRESVTNLVAMRPPDYKGSRIAWIRFAAMQLFVAGHAKSIARTATDVVVSESSKDEAGSLPTVTTN